MNGPRESEHRAPGGAPAEELAAFDPSWRGEWAWIQPRRFQRRWELRCRDRLTAVLVPPFLFAGPGTATFADRTWTVRTRFFSIEVSRAGEPEPWGRFKRGWLLHGKLLRPGGDELRWRPTDVLMRRFVFETVDALPLVHTVLKPGFLRTDGRVELEDAARRMPDLQGLVALAWVLALASQHSKGHGH